MYIYVCLVSGVLGSLCFLDSWTLRFGSHSSSSLFFFSLFFFRFLDLAVTLAPRYSVGIDLVDLVDEEKQLHKMVASRTGAPFWT